MHKWRQANQDVPNVRLTNQLERKTNKENPQHMINQVLQYANILQAAFDHTQAEGDKNVFTLFTSEMYSIIL